MLHRIVVPLDGSTLAESALPTAFALARAAGAQLEVLTVTAPVRAEVVTAPSRAVPDFISTTGLQAEPYLEDLAERVWRATNSRLLTRVAQGRVADQLADYTRAEGDLIVMTSHGHSGFKRAIYGSTAGALIRQARAPVLLVPARESVGLAAKARLFSDVLVALDESDCSEEVLPFAIALGQLAQAKYTLLQVVVSNTALETGVRLNGDADIDTEEKRQAAQAHVRRVASRLERRDLRVTTVVLEQGSVVEAILTYAERTTVDLIALSTHGRSRLGRFVLGSVADRVARAAAVPVLLYRPEGGLH